jgi:hypothetical protein
MDEKLKWDDFTILFVPHMTLRCNLVESEFKAGRRTFDKAYHELKTI